MFFSIPPPPQAARIPTASRFVFPRWLCWVPPTTALLQRRTTKRLYFWAARPVGRSEEHTSELQSRLHLVCRLLLEKKKIRATVHARPGSDLAQPQCRYLPRH